VGEISRVSEIPPSLPGVEFGDGIELPRMSSSASRASRKAGSLAPQIPKKNSKRQSRGTSLTSSELSQVVGGRSPNEPTSAPYDPHVPTQRIRKSMESSKRLSSISTNSVPTKHPDISDAIYTNSALGNMTSKSHNERPISMGSVQHHSPQTVENPSVPLDLLGDSAEVIGDENGVAMQYIGTAK